MTFTIGSLAKRFNENRETQKYFLRSMVCQTSAAMRNSFNNIRGEMVCLAWWMSK